ncbi:MAG: hypothetical protein FWC50_00820, partial [Planctomycetaceae bacterium]|nr:hypothetical protein [Planctomycetaceae bacterium]
MNSNENHNDFNPYAYYETESLRVGALNPYFSPEDANPSKFEPRTPFGLLLVPQIFSLFPRKKYWLAVYHDHCTIERESKELPEPIMIARDDAPERLKLNRRSLQVTDDSGKKVSFSFAPHPWAILNQARLETWCDPAFRNMPEEALQNIEKRIKKRVFVQSYSVIFMLFFFFLLLIAIFPFMTVGIACCILTGGLSIPLLRNQIWALYLCLIFSFIPTMACFLALLFFIPAILPLGGCIAINATFWTGIND